VVTFGSLIARAGIPIGSAQAKEDQMTTVWIYVDTNKEVGDIDTSRYSRRQTLPISGSRRTIRKACVRL